METQHITLAISKDVLAKARRLAVERRTSLSALVTQMIGDIVDQDVSYRVARERQLVSLRDGFDLGSQDAATWTREELHER